MTAEHVNISFYGLFMDMSLLQQRGLAPRHPQVACLDGYDLDIRERATLIRHATTRVYGIVTELTHEDLGTLYADPSVRDYRPEAVMVTLVDARQVRPGVTPCRR